MLKSELAFQSGFFRDIFAERWCECPHEARAQLDQETHSEKALAPNATTKAPVVDDEVEDGLGQTAVELGQAIGELTHIDRDQLVGVLYPVIQRRECVERHLVKIAVVDMVRQACTIPQSQSRLMPRQLHKPPLVSKNNHQPKRVLSKE